jgi:hypothetical protein
MSRVPPRLLAPNARRSRAREAAAIALALGAGLSANADRPLPFEICAFKYLLGLPCPTCGLTRAVCHALHGDWSQSLAYHPAGILLAAALIGWMLWSAAEAARGQPLAESIRARLRALAVGAGVAAALLAWVARLAG